MRSQRNKLAFRSINLFLTGDVPLDADEILNFLMRVKNRSYMHIGLIQLAVLTPIMNYALMNSPSFNVAPQALIKFQVHIAAPILFRARFLSDNFLARETGYSGNCWIGI